MRFNFVTPGRGAVILVLTALAVGWAPAPLPKRTRQVSQPMAGAWDVMWASMPVRLDLRPDSFARFEYQQGGGSWEGSWRFDGGMRVTLTLQIDSVPRDYQLTFDKLGPNEAEGRVRQGTSFNQPLKLTRAGPKSP